MTVTSFVVLLVVGIVGGVVLGFLCFLMGWFFGGLRTRTRDADDYGHWLAEMIKLTKQAR